MTSLIIIAALLHYFVRRDEYSLLKVTELTLSIVCNPLVSVFEYFSGNRFTTLVTFVRPEPGGIGP